MRTSSRPGQPVARARAGWVRHAAARHASGRALSLPHPVSHLTHSQTPVPAVDSQRGCMLVLSPHCRDAVTGGR